MLYTVKEISALAHVTIKTLHHYHKVGLLVPQEISEAGYRLYGQPELERLQQILFYRELDFSLADIRDALAQDSDRINVLTRQRSLLLSRRGRLDRLIKMLDDSLSYAMRSEAMTTSDMFEGFTQSEWKAALTEQSDYLEKTYNYNLLANAPVEAERLNTMAREAMQFQSALAQALRDGLAHHDTRVKKLVADHLAFLVAHGTELDAQGMLAQARFFTNDDFHRRMMENVQIGLAYYYLAAVDAFAAEVNKQ